MLQLLLFYNPYPLGKVKTNLVVKSIACKVLNERVKLVVDSKTGLKGTIDMFLIEPG